MEPQNIAIESNFYGNLTNTVVPKPSWFNDPKYPQDENNKVARLKNATGSQKIGPNIILKVMAGDNYNVRVAGGWSSTVASVDGGNSNVLADLLNVLSNGLANSSGGKASAIDLQNPTSNLSNGLTNFLNTQTTNGANKPKSYLNWILLDEQFNVVPSSCGFSVPLGSSVRAETPAKKGDKK